MKGARGAPKRSGKAKQNHTQRGEMRHIISHSILFTPALLAGGLSTLATPRVLLASNNVDPALFWSCVSPKEPETVRLCYIPTASMYLDPESPSERSMGQRRQRQKGTFKKRMKSVVAALQSSSPSSSAVIESQFLDLSDPKLSAASACEAVAGWADCVYLEGGNTFFLAHHMRRLSCDDALREALSGRDEEEEEDDDDGDSEEMAASPLLLVGISAGAIVSGRSLNTALWKGWDKPIDDLDVADDAAMRGLGLCGERSFFPHYTEEEWAPLVQDRAAALGHECVCLEEQGATLAY